jgi:hypothetical protein
MVLYQQFFQRLLKDIEKGGSAQLKYVEKSSLVLFLKNHFSAW